MPSEKSERVSERKRARNAPLRSRAKTYITKARSLIAANDLEAAERAVQDAVTALDKAAQKGVIHPNNAARRKSRVMKRLSRAKSS